MARATLTLTVPQAIWIGDLSRRHPEMCIRVLAAVPNGDNGVALTELSAADVDGILSDMRAYDTIVDVETLNEGDDGTLVQLETTVPLLLEPLQRSGVPLEMPFTIRNGRVVWEVTTSRDRLSKLGEHLEKIGIPFTVDSIYQKLESEQLLTDRQWKLLRTAADLGYYDTPRGCTQEELADALGIAKSTCSETLHRAEERIVKRFIESSDDPGEFDRLETTV